MKCKLSEHEVINEVIAYKEESILSDDSHAYCNRDWCEACPLCYANNQFRTWICLLYESNTKHTKSREIIKLCRKWLDHNDRREPS